MEPVVDIKDTLVVISKGQEPIVADLIAVHGLQQPSPSEETPALAYSLPNTRILAYSYDPLSVMTNPKQSLELLAQNLLFSIDRLREETGTHKDRPIVFWGLYFGGTVIQEALLFAFNARPISSYYIIYKTCGVIFLGTPQDGWRSESDNSSCQWSELVAASATWDVPCFSCSDEAAYEFLAQLDQQRVASPAHRFSLMARGTRIRMFSLYLNDVSRDVLLNPVGSGERRTCKVFEKDFTKIDGSELLGISFTDPNADLNTHVLPKIQELLERGRVNGVEDKLEIREGAQIGQAYIPAFDDMTYSNTQHLTDNRVGNMTNNSAYNYHDINNSVDNSADNRITHYGENARHGIELRNAGPAARYNITVNSKHYYGSPSAEHQPRQIRNRH